ncbi:hypothetical protein BT69DRAFT_1285443 [Atractiella rhizophila]|nr:hypothetical protein BT69DRAFT_1285443 [Atractiella rhizophila]
MARNTFRQLEMAYSGCEVKFASVNASIWNTNTNDPQSSESTLFPASSEVNTWVRTIQ